MSKIIWLVIIIIIILALAYYLGYIEF